MMPLKHFYYLVSRGIIHTKQSAKDNKTMYNLKIIQCGNDRIEIYKVNNYIIREGECKDLDEEKIIGEGGGNQSTKDKKRNLRDSRNNIIRLIKCNDDMKTFITLTFAKETDYKESKKYLNNLFNKLRRAYYNLKYIWVLEYGDKKGRLHYHMLCNIPINIKLSNSKERKSENHKNLENNFEKKFWKYGFVDIRHLEQEDNTNIALYVSSYIVKSMENISLEGYRVFGYSRKTLDKPIETKIYTRDGIESILKCFVEDFELKFSNSYPIGYVDWKGEHSGTVSYYDFIKN